MNDKNLKALELMSGIDEQFLTEEKSIRVSHTRPKRLIAIAAAAAALTAVFTIGAVAAVRSNIISNKENVAHEYDDSDVMSVIEKTEQQPAYYQNEHIRLTVDTVLADKYYVKCTATLQALDDAGRDYLEKLLILPEEVELMTEDEFLSYDSGQQIPFMEAFDKSGSLLSYMNGTADLMYGRQGENAEMTFTFSVNKNRLAGNEDIIVRAFDLSTITSKNMGLDDIQPGIFEGIGDIEINATTNLKDVTLTADDGSSVYFSELDIRTDTTADGVEDTFANNAESVLTFKDGSTQTFKVVDVTFGAQHFDVDNIASFSYNGNTYTPEN